MDKFIIKGGKRLHGEVVISGAKNAAVAIIPAVAMAESPCRIENVPNISDVKLSARILTEMGATVRWLGKNTVEIDPTMRARFSMLPPNSSSRLLYIGDVNWLMR